MEHLMSLSNIWIWEYIICPKYFNLARWNPTLIYILFINLYFSNFQKHYLVLVRSKDNIWNTRWLASHSLVSKLRKDVFVCSHFGFFQNYQEYFLGLRYIFKNSHLCKLFHKFHSKIIYSFDKLIFYFTQWANKITYSIKIIQDFICEFVLETVIYDKVFAFCQWNILFIVWIYYSRKSACCHIYTVFLPFF